jgi:MFS family permease
MADSTLNPEYSNINEIDTASKPEIQAEEERSGLDAVSTTPTEEKNKFYALFLTLATMVGGLSSVCIKQLLLPIQVSLLAPTNTNTSFTIVASVGAFAGLLAAPLTGALSDRTTMRWGRRRPWIIFGIVATVVGMMIMAYSTSIPTLLIGEIIAQVGVDTILATVTALIPDQVPVTQRSLISAFVGLAPNVGGVLGLILVTRLTNTHIVSEGYTLMAGVSAVCILLFLIILREKPIVRESVPPFNLGRFMASFFHPLKSADFTYVLISRCFVYLSFTILGAYLLFYLRGALHFTIPAAAGGVTTFQLLSTVVLLITAITTGIMSDRLKRLKPFVLIGALLMAVGLFLLALMPAMWALLTAAVIFGGGFGLYLGVDIALAVRVLPSDATSGKDLGIIYTSIFLSLILSPIIGGTVLNLSHNNFTLLFILAAISSVIAAVLIFPIKSVR